MFDVLTSQSEREMEYVVKSLHYEKLLVKANQMTPVPGRVDQAQATVPVGMAYLTPRSFALGM